MPEVHLPHLEDEDDHQHEDKLDAPAAVPHRRLRGKTALKLALEVLLIGTGVFLGLAGEQWRESREHRLDDATLIEPQLLKMYDELLPKIEAVQHR